MVQIQDLTRLVELAGQRKLELRDCALILALITHTEASTGRIKVTAPRLAEDLQVQEAEVRAGISRLKKQLMLRLIKNRDTGERYYLLNPWVVRSGRESLVGLAMQEFKAA